VNITVDVQEAETRLYDLLARVEAWSARLSEVGMIEIAIDTSDASLAGSLPWEHRDPFDRLLVAQAIRRNAVLVTVDRTILALPGVRTLTW
jgi:PIN domain nuclease of toxin-antitoxin system